MADETAEQLVERCYRRLLERKGITKGAGGAVVDHHELTTEVVAEIGVQWRRQLKRNEKQLRRNGRKLEALAASYGAAVAPVRGVADIQQGMVDLDLQRFGVGLVDRSAVPKRTNGHSSSNVTETGPSSAPLWHPDSE